MIQLNQYQPIFPLQVYQEFLLLFELQQIVQINLQNNSLQNYTLEQQILGILIIEDIIFILNEGFVITQYKIQNQNLKKIQQFENTIKNISQFFYVNNDLYIFRTDQGQLIDSKNVFIDDQIIQSDQQRYSKTHIQGEIINVNQYYPKIDIFNNQIITYNKQKLISYCIQSNYQKNEYMNHLMQIKDFCIFNDELVITIAQDLHLYVLNDQFQVIQFNYLSTIPQKIIMHNQYKQVCLIQYFNGDIQVLKNFKKEIFFKQLDNQVQLIDFNIFYLNNSNILKSIEIPQTELYEIIL